MICPKYGYKNWPSGSEEMLKSNRQMDDRQRAIRKAHLRLQLRLAKNLESKKIIPILESEVTINKYLSFFGLIKLNMTTYTVHVYMYLSNCYLLKMCV
jgi:fructose-bisphosphate aldolase class 1